MQQFPDAESITIILASSSPYRRQLLERLGLEFRIENPAIDETALAGETPEDLVSRLALAKATVVSNQESGSLVIGSDLCASLAGQLLGKPGTTQRAIDQLQKFSGQLVEFYTAVAVVAAESAFSEVLTVATRVRFRVLDISTIRHYVAIEQPLDCAGSFKSEALGISLFESVESSDPTALVGLPLIATCSLLGAAGIAIP